LRSVDARAPPSAAGAVAGGGWIAEGVAEDDAEDSSG